MSRRTRQYRVHRRETVNDTFTAIVHAHRTTSNVGRVYDSMLDIANNVSTPASKPIGEEKAMRIAQTLHKSKW